METDAFHIGKIYIYIYIHILFRLEFSCSILYVSCACVKCLNVLEYKYMREIVNIEAYVITRMNEREREGRRKMRTRPRERRRECMKLRENEREPR